MKIGKEFLPFNVCAAALLGSNTGNLTIAVGVDRFESARLDACDLRIDARCMVTDLLTFRDGLQDLIDGALQQRRVLVARVLQLIMDCFAEVQHNDVFSAQPGWRRSCGFDLFTLATSCEGVRNAGSNKSLLADAAEHGSAHTIVWVQEGRVEVRVYDEKVSTDRFPAYLCGFAVEDFDGDSLNGVCLRDAIDAESALRRGLDVMNIREGEDGSLYVSGDSMSDFEYARLRKACAKTQALYGFDKLSGDVYVGSAYEHNSDDGHTFYLVDEGCGKRAVYCIGNGRAFCQFMANLVSVSKTGMSDRFRDRLSVRESQQRFGKLFVGLGKGVHCGPGLNGYQLNEVRRAASANVRIVFRGKEVYF